MGNARVPDKQETPILPCRIKSKPAKGRGNLDQLQVGGSEGQQRSLGSCRQHRTGPAGLFHERAQLQEHGIQPRDRHAEISAEVWQVVCVGLGQYHQIPSARVMEAKARSNHLVLSEPTEQTEQAEQAEGSRQAG